MVRVASIGKSLRWIVAGLLLALYLLGGSWSPGVYAGPGLSQQCQSFFTDYLNWAKGGNPVGFTLASNQNNWAVAYAAHIPLAFYPHNPALLGSVDQFVGTARAGSDLSNWQTFTYYPPGCDPSNCFGNTQPFNTQVNDTLTLTIALNGTMHIASSNLGNVDFTFDCNKGVIIGQSTNPWSTTILVSLEKLPPPSK